MQPQPSREESSVRSVITAVMRQEPYAREETLLTAFWS
ncbi:MAG: hypothetical protein RL042_823 [Nitrospirota bacterium]|jgi:hypothetical protein